MKETFFGRYPGSRLRRPRLRAFSRELMAETQLSVSNLIYPVFIHDEAHDVPIQSLMGQSRLSIKSLFLKAAECVELGIPAIMLFPVISPELKSLDAKAAYDPNGLIPKVVSALKREFPELGILTDIALDPYTTHGQDGIINDNGEILNDETIEVLIKQALVHAESGADMICPSDMMDGRIGEIRNILERSNYTSTQILAYSAKYASSFYGPFRDAVGSSAALGKSNKRSYQLDPKNRQEALREVALDIAEGADFVMVKPGLPYLDIVREVKSAFEMPTIVYQVSGEYAMLKAAAIQNWLSERETVLETLIAFRRAGADAIITYYGLEVAKWLSEARQP